jgi:hypothetical protein
VFGDVGHGRAALGRFFHCASRAGAVAKARNAKGMIVLTVPLIICGGQRAKTRHLGRLSGLFVGWILN